MLSYTRLSGNARRFKILMGMSLQEFDLLFAKVKDACPEAEEERLSKRPRRRAIGAGRKFALDLRNRVMLLPFHYRTYATQDVAAEIDDISRFECPGQLVAWTGMCPTLHQSENVEYHGRTSKATNRLVNWIMIQCALTASVYDPKMSIGRTVRHITFSHGLGMWPRLTALVLPSICRAVGALFSSPAAPECAVPAYLSPHVSGVGMESGSTGHRALENPPCMAVRSIWPMALNADSAEARLPAIRVDGKDSHASLLTTHVWNHFLGDSVELARR